MENLPINWLLNRFFEQYPHYRPPASPAPPISSDDEYEPDSDYDTEEDEDL